MNMELRKMFRDFVSWQIEKGYITELTIDYEVAETYLEEKEVEILNMYSVVGRSGQFNCPYCNSSNIAQKTKSNDWCKDCKREWAV